MTTTMLDLTEVCALCGHWRDEHIHVSDNPDEPDGSYCEACRLNGNRDHEYKAQS